MSTLYRKRLIPNECILLKDDEILFQNQNIILTKWKTFRPKEDFSWGISCYVMDKGYKISKFFKDDNSLTYIYCDIISTDYDKNTDTYTFTDLLADVIVENDNTVRIVDLDELSEALSEGTISVKLASKALFILDSLLKEITNKSFYEYINKIDSYM